MKSGKLTTPGQGPWQTDESRPVGGASGQAPRTEDSPELIDAGQLFGPLEEDHDELDDTDDTANLPSITSMPDGIEVVEQFAGVAEGQWLLLVRCQCGRRWFEVAAIPIATCPRCGLLVSVNIAEPGPPS